MWVSRSSFFDNSIKHDDAENRKDTKDYLPRPGNNRFGIKKDTGVSRPSRVRLSVARVTITVPVNASGPDLTRVTRKPYGKPGR